MGHKYDGIRTGVNATAFEEIADDLTRRAQEVHLLNEAYTSMRRDLVVLLNWMAQYDWATLQELAPTQTGLVGLGEQVERLQNEYGLKDDAG
jgi:hypothetical protein